MAFGDTIDRSGASALMPEDVSREIIQGVPEASAVMRLARRLPNMARNQQRLPVLSALIEAYFVTGDTGLKQTSAPDWSNKYIDAEELAVIVPIPENVLNDADYDIWAEIRPRIVEAFGRAFDKAVLFGENAPTAWPDDIKTAANAAGNSVTLGTGADLYDDILSENGVFAQVEEDGFMVTGSVAALIMMARLRGLRDANGQPIFLENMQDGPRYMLAGRDLVFPTNGGFDATELLLVAGDWNQLVYSIRQDISYKMLDQAVLQDGAGNILYNLAQQDMVALRAVLRLGWQVPNPISAVQPTEANRYPFGTLVPA